MDIVISYIMPCITAVTSGFVLFYLQKLFNEQKEKERQKENVKNVELELILRSLNALGKLTVANTISLRDGKTNGEIATALQEYHDVEKELYGYMISHRSD